MLKLLSSDVRDGSHPEELALSTTGPLYPRTADVKAKSHEVRVGPILLQKSGCNRRMSFGRSRGPTGVDPPILMLSTQLLRYAVHRAVWSRNQRREAPEILSDGSQNKLILRASWTTKSKPTEPQDALQVREPHLDLLALAARLFKALGAGERRATSRACSWIIARDLA